MAERATSSQRTFSWLLVSLAVFFVLHPLYGYHLFGRLVSVVLMSLVLLAATRTLATPRLRALGLGLALAAIAAHWAQLASDARGLTIVSTLLAATFLMFVTVLILRTVLSAQSVTGQTIAAALCVYLLIGITWAVLYELVETLSPGSFALAPSLQAVVTADSEGQNVLPLFVYYSLVTLTTLGYGDVTPLTPWARMLATVEAAGGQLYLAVLIARLVGLNATERAARR